MTTTGVLVAGAGPGGCVTALSLARRGRRVMLVSPESSPGRGLSGEWLHPAGVAALQRLGVDLHGADFTENHGFVLHPGTGGTPVTLPYPRGAAVSMRHHVLVEWLRQAVTADPGISFLLGDRVTRTDEDGSTVTTAGVVRADLVVGAEGRASLVRRALRPAEPPAPTLSTAAGLELHGVSLPTEGCGHVFLGGPGPVLAYRIDPDTVRLLLDVPPCRLPPAAMLGHLHHHYAPALPENLRTAFVESVQRGTAALRWAANRFRGRQYYGHGRRALVGDAVGFGHPLAALGMTTAILDGECLAGHSDIASYARERRARSWAAERLGMALHRALTGTDTASVVLREALFHLWRGNTIERNRMMRLLAVQEDSRTQFGLAVAHIATTALRHTGRPGGRGLSQLLTHRVRSTRDLASWLHWLYCREPRVPPGQRTAMAAESAMAATSDRSRRHQLT